MARLLRIENCLDCPLAVWRDEDEQLGCDDVRDEDNYATSVGKGIGTPDWCPLPEEATSES